MLSRARKRRSLGYTSGVFCFTGAGPPFLPYESRHQVGELQKICHPEQRATLADHDLWIRCDDIRPLPRHRAHAICVDVQHEPRAIPIVPLAYADELPPAERMERVRDAHKTRRRVGRDCILC
jgi:hypothetical protein